MKKHTHKRRNSWRRAGLPFTAGDGLRLFALSAVIALLAWTGVALVPVDDARGAVSPVVINRVMTSNPSACYSVDGKYYDWVELRNISDAPVSLSGWRLGDSVDQRGAFELGDAVLPPGDGMIVYCARRPEGYEGGERFTGFRLSANGEVLVLSDGRRQLAQVLEVPPMAAAQVYQREDDGNYRVVSFQTMASAGAVDLRPAFAPDGVYISEVMAANRTQLQDEDGDWPDWIELYNGGSEAVDLAGWALSDDDANQRKWVFPALTLQPGEYRVVFASGKDRREGTLHTNFKLSTASESVRLYDAGGSVRSWVEYEDLPKEIALSRLPDGSLTRQVAPTPGYENTEAGVRAARTLVTASAGDLRINEIMASGGGSDWIELYNDADHSLDLTGVGLSDETKHPRRWQFPEGALIPAKGFVTVLLTGNGGASGIQNGRYCADFALAAGETIVLAEPDGTLLDRVALFEQYRNVSYGRAEGHERYRYFEEATPGAANTTPSYARKAANVAFSEPGGQHAVKRLTVTLTAEPDVQIYYTTDGTEPTTSSRTYTGPIELKSGTLIKAMAWQADVIPSDLCVQGYILGANHTVRLVSVWGDSAALDGKTGMLNTGVKGEGSDAYVEVYEPDGTRVIAQGCLMKLVGHSSRDHEKQKGFSLRAKKIYGESRFNYALFSGRDYTSYKSFVMRASGQDCRQTFMRDSILSALAADTSLLYRETEVCVVYVNGRYWGVYNMRERVSNEMIAQFHGWDDPDDVEFKEGRGASSEGFQQLMAWVAAHDLSDDGNVEALRGMMDIENYLEYVIVEMYINNQDLGNVGFYRNPNADGLWRWALFDLDLSYQLAGDNVAAWLEGEAVGTITTQSNLLFRKLMANAGLRDWFLRRMGQLLATTFSPENVVSKIQTRYTLLEPEMEAECKRWGWTTATWKRYGQRMIRYAKSRPASLVGYLTADFKLTEAQAREYFGGVG